MKAFFRIKDWWWSKAALLMGFVYLYAAWFGISFEKMVWLSLLSVSTIAGFASLGYFSNDFFDREKDLLVGKRNFLLGKSPVLVFFLFTFSLLLLAWPWWYLPFNKISIALIAAELLLFFLYAAKPFRFKERGAAGIITDALYAHVVPVLLSLYTFMLAAEKPFFILAVILLLLWQTASGIRNILIHQYEDADKDRLGGIKNFAAGIPALKNLLYIKVLITCELILSMLFFLYLTSANSLFIYCPLLLLFFTLLVLIAFYNPGISVLLQTRWKYFPNPVFEKWIPVAVLAILSANDLRFLWFLLFHVVVFNSGFLIQSNHYFIPALIRFIDLIVKGIWYKILTPVRILFSLAVNYFIYFLLRLFKIDLKKEQTTAIDYFKKKITGK